MYDQMSLVEHISDWDCKYMKQNHNNIIVQDKTFIKNIPIKTGLKKLKRLKIYQL